MKKGSEIGGKERPDGLMNSASLPALARDLSPSRVLSNYGRVFGATLEERNALVGETTDKFLDPRRVEKVWLLASPLPLLLHNCQSPAGFT